MNFISSYFFDPSDYEIIEIIGKGQFSTVSLCKERRTGDMYAFKQINGKPSTRSFLRELEILISVAHTCMVRFSGFFIDFKSLDTLPILKLEYVDGGTLSAALTSFALSQTDKSIIAYGIASAMKCLHEHRIIHRDLKPQNVLLTKNHEPKLADFNTSKYLEADSQSISNQCGTVMYSSPELLSGKSNGFPTDVWSYSLILYELLTGNTPFQGLRWMSLCRKIQDGYRPEIPAKDADLKITKLIMKCWSFDPKARPSFEEIVEQFNDPEILFPDTNVEEFMDYKERIIHENTHIVDVETQTAESSFC